MSNVAATSELSHLDPSDPDFAVRVVELLLPMAIERRASDVHVQPREGGWEILFRVDGVLSPVQFLRGGGASDPVARLMVLAALPTYRSSQPLEGRLNWQSDGTTVSIRLGVFPTVHGPRAVVRLLRRDEAHDSIDLLGLPPKHVATLTQLCAVTDGLVLLSGPAGSGKTTTMYAMLRHIAAQVPRRSVVTIEDPVEAVIPSISQSEIDHAGGLTLASALRSAVRQDSEVLLVSEIRDPETAEAALQASLTGHLVFSSIHATDVPSAMRRLVQLGVPGYAIRSGVRAIVSQRLLRRTCPRCGSGSQETCADCLGSGYLGRVAIAQCVRFDGIDPVGDAIAESMQAGDSVNRMRAIAAELGAVDLRMEAQRRIDDGLTDPAEVYRVLGRE